MRVWASKVLAIVASSMILALVLSDGRAQCPTGARAFATIGGGLTTQKLRVDQAASGPGAYDQGLERGRFWECTTGDGNNFIFGDPARRMDPTGCPSTGNGQAGGGWWKSTQTVFRGVEGFLSGTGCTASSCPQGDLCTVVEDFGVDGPPGVGGTAYVIGWRSNETPPDIRYWDHSRFCGTADCVVPFEEFPVPIITSSTRNGSRVDLTTNGDDVAASIYVYTPLVGPASDLVVSYDLLKHIGQTDPGRDRNDTNCAPPNLDGRCWNKLMSIPYEDAELTGVPVHVACDNELDDVFIAFGLSFEGGAKGPVPSELVGRTIQIECDPNLADPHPPIRSSMRVPN